MFVQILQRIRGLSLKYMYFLIEKGKFVFSNAFIAEGKVSLCFNQPPEIFTKFCFEKSFFSPGLLFVIDKKEIGGIGQS